MLSQELHHLSLHFAAQAANDGLVTVTAATALALSAQLADLAEQAETLERGGRPVEAPAAPRPRLVRPERTPGRARAEARGLSLIDGGVR